MASSLCEQYLETAVNFTRLLKREKKTKPQWDDGGSFIVERMNEFSSQGEMRKKAEFFTVDLKDLIGYDVKEKRLSFVGSLEVATKWVWVSE